MIFNPLLLISFLMSVLFAFVTVALIVEFICICFQFRNYRLRYWLRYLPLIAVIIEFCTLGHGVGHWINPLSCASCLQKILLKIFFSDLQIYLNTNQISLVNYLAHDLSDRVGYFISLLCGGITIFFVSRHIYQISCVNKLVKGLINESTPCRLKLNNDSLCRLIEHHKIQILEHPTVKTPLATHLNCIILPSNIIENLSQTEIEAVIVHEIEHIRWNDPILKTCCHFVASVCWWLPLGSWIKKMEFDQEMASDQGILVHQFSGDHLASALLKVAYNMREAKLKAVCYFVCEERKSPIKRIHAILNLYPKEQLSITHLLLVILGTTLLIACLLCTPTIS